MDVKLQPLCQASKPPHPISLKSLTEVKFTQEPRDKNDTGEPIVSCPSCRKTITNNVKSYGEPSPGLAVVLSPETDFEIFPSGQS